MDSSGFPKLLTQVRSSAQHANNKFKCKEDWSVHDEGDFSDAAIALCAARHVQFNALCGDGRVCTSVCTGSKSEVNHCLCAPK